MPQPERANDRNPLDPLSFRIISHRLFIRSSTLFLPHFPNYFPRGRTIPGILSQGVWIHNSHFLFQGSLHLELVAGAF